MRNPKPRYLYAHMKTVPGQLSRKVNKKNDKEKRKEKLFVCLPLCPGTMRAANHKNMTLLTLRL